MTTAAFIAASRIKLRFDTPQGQLTVEDLWDLPLSSEKPNRANLDDIAVGLHNALQTSATTSFVKNPAQTNPSVQIAFDVVKHIIDTRLAENEAARTAAANKAKKAQLLDILARKESAAMESLSADEIKALINSLG